ncbi:MAG: hypothetical protein RI885_277 [Actinomycetota bacterium]|jgi:L-aspartate oxidase
MATRLGVIVVGSGIAGLTAALHASEHHDVTLVTKGALGDGNTRWAQGGIAAVTPAVTPAVSPPPGSAAESAADSTADSVASHFADTIVAGAGLCDPAAVRVLVNEAPHRIDELVASGVRFDRDPVTGGFALALEAAHSRARVLRAGGDATGAAIARALAARVRFRDIRILEHHALLDLLLDGGRVVGMTALEPGGRVVSIAADVVVMATGGAGRLFTHTTNPLEATGDGIAAAARAGAGLADLEFVQFHPTALAGPVNFLISEAVRGEGAVLLDRDGDRFMLSEHDDAELAPRDVVARTMALTMQKQGGLPIRLDARHLGASFLRERFPTIDSELRGHRIDWTEETVPVTPAAHYMMGGIDVDLDGRSSLLGLFAVGECARTGVHGANRLASNSLIEGAVFGARAAAALGRPWPRGATGPRGRIGESTSTIGTVAAAHASGPSFDLPATTAPFSRSALQRLLWSHVGLIRDDRGLGEAARTLAGWTTKRGSASPTSVTEIEDRSLLELGVAVVDAALARTGSVGAHFRSDDTATAITRADIASAGADTARLGSDRHTEEARLEPAW